MSKLKRLRVDGFRRLCDLDLEMRDLAVLIGANGSGKTSLLDVFSLLSASARGGLADKMNELGGLSSVATVGREPKFSIALDLDDESPIKYGFGVVSSGVGYEVRDEQFDYPGWGAGPVAIGTIALKPYETGIGQGGGLGLPEYDRVRELLASSASYHSLNVDPRSPVRLPQSVRPAKLPGKDGEDLGSCLYSMQQSSRARFDAVEDALRAAFPGFQRLELPPVAAGMLAMLWWDEHFRRPFYMNELSEGTLRFLWLTTLLQSPGLPAITLIDEPEVSLHPELLSLLADLLREASRRSQIIVATHSDRLVRFLKPEEVVVVDLEENGLARFTWADKLDLEKWLDEYTLDEVWHMGRLGGRA